MFYSSLRTQLYIPLQTIKVQEDYHRSLTAIPLLEQPDTEIILDLVTQPRGRPQGGHQLAIRICTSKPGEVKI